VSFVDYALRPWTIAVSHRGLTDPSLYARTITVWHLTKMGAKRNMAKRKVFKYHNCFPISIDQQEYNYSGDDINIKRAVSFGYHYYTVEDADDEVLNLLNFSSQEKSAIGKALDFFGLGNIGDQALDQIRSQFGANSVSQYLNNIVERGKSFTRSVVSNTVQGAISNVGGAVQGAVDGAIRDVTSQGLAAGNRAVNAIADTANDAVNSIAGSNPNSDTVNGVNVNLSGGSVNTAGQSSSENASVGRLAKYGYVEKFFNTEDSPIHILPITDTEQADVVEDSLVEVSLPVNSNDVPNFTGDEVTEVDGGISIARPSTSNENPNDDTPNFLNGPSTNLLYYKEKRVNENDTTSFVSTSPDSKPINAFKKGTDQATESNIDAVENAFSNFVENNKDDSNIGENLNDYVEIEISQNDSTPSDSLSFEPIQISESDSNPSDSIEYNQVNVSDNDSNPSDSIKYNQVNVAENDSNPSDSITFNQLSVSENDSNPSDSITFNQLSVSENDSNPSDSVKYKERSVPQRDSNASDDINYKKVSVKNNDSNTAENLNYKSVSTERNQSTPSDSITYKEVKTDKNDSTISNNLNFKKKNILKDDVL
jgi:hypothetical protein